LFAIGLITSAVVALTVLMATTADVVGAQFSCVGWRQGVRAAQPRPDLPWRSGGAHWTLLCRKPGQDFGHKHAGRSSRTIRGPHVCRKVAAQDPAVDSDPDVEGWKNLIPVADRNQSSYPCSGNSSWTQKMLIPSNCLTGLRSSILTSCSSCCLQLQRLCLRCWRSHSKCWSPRWRLGRLPRQDNWSARRQRAHFVGGVS